MSKYTREQACKMAAEINPASGHANAAYWVGDDATRDYLMTQLLRDMEKTLAVIGKRIVDIEPADYSDDDAAEEAGVKAILDARDEG